MPLHITHVLKLKMLLMWKKCSCYPVARVCSEFFFFSVLLSGVFFVVAAIRVTVLCGCQGIAMWLPGICNAVAMLFRVVAKVLLYNECCVARGLLYSF